MLAALAQPSNNTESQVLQRLFSLCDVNSKAAQVCNYFSYYLHVEKPTHLSHSIIAWADGAYALGQPWKSGSCPPSASRWR